MGKTLKHKLKARKTRSFREYARLCVVGRPWPSFSLSTQKDCHVALVGISTS
jgi:hypothetical protein